MNKYGNHKTIVDGIKFDSKREAKRYGELILLQKAGEIENLELQPKFPIVIGDIAVKYPSGRQLTYIADFRYTDTLTGETVVEDAKGFSPLYYKIKRALMHTMGIEIVEV